jgi:hypothetical protein
MLLLRETAFGMPQAARMLQEMRRKEKQVQGALMTKGKHSVG